jgi:hypothetical protein
MKTRTTTKIQTKTRTKTQNPRVKAGRRSASVSKRRTNHRSASAADSNRQQRLQVDQ